MQVKLFADLAEAAGRKRVDLDVGPDATVTDVVDALVAAHPDLEAEILDEDAGLQDHLNVLRNGQSVFAAGDGLETPVDEDDELALFPPVSGGAPADRVA